MSIVQQKAYGFESNRANSLGIRDDTGGDLLFVYATGNADAVVFDQVYDGYVCMLRNLFLGSAGDVGNATLYLRDALNAIKLPVGKWFYSTTGFIMSYTATCQKEIPILYGEDLWIDVSAANVGWTVGAVLALVPK